MNAEILAVGTELLLGDILNTNAQYLSRRLADIGVNVFYQSVVGDNKQRLEECVRLSKQRCDVVIVTGGLGPTQDDLTKQTIAALYNDTLALNETELEKIRSFFEKSGRDMPQNNQKQAQCPVRGKTLQNFNGTAPGAIFSDNGKHAILLPGPPSEMKPMFEQYVVPWLLQKSKAAISSRVLRVAGVGESHLEELLADFLSGENPTCALYAKTGEVIIRVTAKEQTPEKAQSLLNICCDKLYERLGSKIYGEGDDGIESAVVELLKKKRLTLASAESCTGGMLSARITAVPGSSEVFGFGVCTYANEAKTKLLCVNSHTLEKYGAVSPKTAREMALGICSLSNADIGIAITGIAGPTGGSAEKPVGLVYISACFEGKTYVQKMLYENRTRDTVREAAVKKALNMARLLLLGENVVQ